MRIEFTNAERTEAIVTRGWWRWKRQARIKRDPSWRFVVSGRYVDSEIQDAVDAAVRRDNRKQERQRVESDWQPVRRASLPQARLVERKPDPACDCHDVPSRHLDDDGHLPRCKAKPSRASGRCVKA